MGEGRRDGFLRVLDLGPLPEMLSRQVGSRSVERVFRAQGLPTSLLENPLQFIPIRDFCGLHEWAVRIAGDPGFGAELATTFDIRHLGPLGTFLYSAPTLGSMIRREMRALALHQNVGVIKLDVKAGVARYAYATAHGSLLGQRYAGMRSLFALLSLARGFMGEKWRPSGMEVEYSKGPETSAFESQFGVPVIYNSDAFALTFPSSDLETLNPNLSPAERQMTFREFAYALKVQPPRTIVEATRAVLAMRLLDGEGDIEGTASKLGLGPRTLQRRLRDEGTSYRNMLSAVRLERATSMLQESMEPIEAIARSLGYAATSHFTRAFTQWTGAPPSHVRQRHRRSSIS